MDKSTKFWPSEISLLHHYGFKSEYRAHLAWELIRTHPNIAGVEAGEDSSGRSQLKLQTPEELVKRSFAIADLYIECAIERGDLAHVEITPEKQAEEIGKLESIKQDETYNWARREKAKEKV